MEDREFVEQQEDEQIEDAVIDEENEQLEEQEENDAKSGKSAKSQASPYFQDAIKNYLDSYASTDEAFKIQYENPKKNISDCCNYIINQVKATGRNGFADEEIYKMARDYYVDEINEKDLVKTRATVIVNHTIELTEEEKNKARVEAMKKLEEEILQEERKKREAEAKAQAKAEEKARKKEEERIRKDEEKKKQEEEKKAQELANAKANGGGEQMSLFDF